MQVLFSKLSRFSRLNQLPIRSMAYLHFTEKPFRNMTEKDFTNYPEISRILKINAPKRTKRGLRGLYHGKQTKSGNIITFSEKKTKRTWKPNVFKKELYSQILRRKINVEVSSKALKCMRKYGGFDNYIILTKPKKMDSFYGEYLRALMMRKLNHPEFNVPYILKSKPVKINVNRRLLKFNQLPTIYFPKDLRNVDMYKDRIKNPWEMTKKELAQFNEMNELAEAQEDVQTNNPYLKINLKGDEEAMRLLEPERLKVMEMLKRKKNQKKMAKMNEELQRDLDEGWSLK